jgi:hypothetical protein
LPCSTFLGNFLGDTPKQAKTLPVGESRGKHLRELDAPFLSRGLIATICS